MSSEYSIALEDGEDTLSELMPIYAQHYDEMRQRREADGEFLPPFNPRVDEYVRSWRSGHLFNFVVRDKNGCAVGYSNVYVTNDMHNGQKIAQEDTIFILKNHRNGVGRRLVRFVLNYLEGLGVERVYITPVTDLRVAKIWKRMGFRSIAELMTYSFGDM